MARVAQHGQMLRRDPPVGGEGRDHIGLPARQRLVHEGRAIGVRRAELERIGALHRRPFGPLEKFEIGAERQLRRDAHEIVERRDALRLGRRVLHRKGIGILEPQRAEQPNLRRLRRPIADRRDHRGACRNVAALHLVGPDRAGIIDIDVDRVGLERAEHHRRTEPVAILHVVARALEPMPDDAREDILLAEILRADRDRIARTRPQRRQREQNADQQHAARRPHPPALALRDAALDQPEQRIDRERERRRAEAAGEHQRPVLRLEAGKDHVAKARLPDRGRQRRGTDRPHRRGADPRHQHRRDERRLD